MKKMVKKEKIYTAEEVKYYLNKLQRHFDKHWKEIEKMLRHMAR